MISHGHSVDISWWNLVFSCFFSLEYTTWSKGRTCKIWALLVFKWTSVPEWLSSAVLKWTQRKRRVKDQKGSAWGFISQSFSYSLLRSRFCLTLISSATHVGLWATSPRTNMCVQNTPSLLILPPQDTMVAFKANRLVAHQWSLDIVCILDPETKQKNFPSRGGVSPAKLLLCFRINSKILRF